MTDRELLQQALNVIEEAQAYTSCETFSPSMTKECAITAEAIRTALAQTEPEFCDPSYKIYKLVEMILSDCGISSNNQMLLDRVAKRIETYLTKQPEPVGCITEVHTKTSFGGTVVVVPQMYGFLPIGTMLYTAPPKKEWVGLTIEDIRYIRDNTERDDRDSVIDMTAEILQEKNT